MKLLTFLTKNLAKSLPQGRMSYKVTKFYSAGTRVNDDYQVEIIKKWRRKVKERQTDKGRECKKKNL